MPGPIPDPKGIVLNEKPISSFEKLNIKCFSQVILINTMRKNKAG